jgi:peptide/nickel transport system permease protein
MSTLTTAAQRQSLESFSSLVWRRFTKHRLALISLFILLAFVVLSLCAPIIESYLGVSHKTANLNSTNLSSSWIHIMGTNELGQDVFTRLIFGGRISLLVGFLAAITSALIGAVIGLLAGFYGGYVDAILMRFTDAMLSIPVLPLMIVFAALDLNRFFSHTLSLDSLFFIFFAVFGLFLLLRFVTDEKRKKIENHYFLRLCVDGLLAAIFFVGSYVLLFGLIPWKTLNEGNFASVIKLILIIVFFGWMTVARLARASAMQLKNMEFVIAARALGANSQRILLAHIFPNALAPIIVAATLEVGSNILYEAALSFLGLGIQPPVSSWGNMLNNAVEYIKSTPSLAFWPGFFILVTVACFNFLGDGMRDALDPHQVIKSAKGKS